MLLALLFLMELTLVLKLEQYSVSIIDLPFREIIKFNNETKMLHFLGHIGIIYNKVIPFYYK